MRLWSILMAVCLTLDTLAASDGPGRRNYPSRPITSIVPFRRHGSGRYLCAHGVGTSCKRR